MTFGIQYSREVLLQDLLPTGQFLFSRQDGQQIEENHPLTKMFLEKTQQFKINITQGQGLNFSNLFATSSTWGISVEQIWKSGTCGFFRGEKKGIQVGSKVENLIVSVVIFGHPFEKYAQVKLDHETPKSSKIWVPSEILETTT